jgi:hypothetical protein
MQLTDIQKQMMATFLSLRVGIGVIGIVFPFFLLLGGRILYGIPQADSMSAYYHATPACLDPHLDNDQTQCAANPLPTGEGPMRNWFVGSLFAIGVGLYLIKGFSKQENVLLTVAGILAVCVALFPMPWVRGKPTWQHVHYISAVTFFVLIGLVIWICSGKTLKFMPDTTPNRDQVIARFKHAYRVLAIVMAASPFAAILLFKVLNLPQGIFWAEAAGVVSFGAFWLVKTWELSKSEVEHRALRGEINMDTSKLQ